jgi:hypothetical protein
MMYHSRTDCVAGSRQGFAIHGITIELFITLAPIAARLQYCGSEPSLHSTHPFCFPSPNLNPPRPVPQIKGSLKGSKDVIDKITGKSTGEVLRIPGKIRKESLHMNTMANT